MTNATFKFVKANAGFYKLYQYDRNGNIINCLSNIYKKGSKWFYDYMGFENEPEKTLKDVKQILKNIYKF